MRSAHDSEKVEVEGSIPLVPTIFDAPLAHLV